MTLLSKELIIATTKMHGQSGLGESKQKQKEDFIKHFNFDILHLQEIEL